jgi:molybdate transport system substrate-binding protein
MKGGTLVRAGKLGLILFLLQSQVAEATEIKIIGSTGVASVVTELVRQYEAKSGNKVQTDFAVIAVSKRKIDVGAPFDIAILGPSTVDELIQKGKIIGDTRASFGRTGLGIIARKGGVKKHEVADALAGTIRHSCDNHAAIAVPAQDDVVQILTGAH